MGRDEGQIKATLSIQVFQSSRPVWGETLNVNTFLRKNPISILSPRVGRDQIGEVMQDCIYSISILSPRVGRDILELFQFLIFRLFQSSRPVWGETLMASTLKAPFDISILSPRVGRDDS